MHAIPRTSSFLALVLGLALAALAPACGGTGPDVREVPDASTDLAAPAEAPAAKDTTSPGTQRTAVFAGGCFWCTEAVFEELRGVGDVVSGYAGGDADQAEYRLVSSGRTSHAEAIRIPYDPSVIGYAQLLKVFFTAAHDPTQLNRQGPDHGTQYRSAIFYSSDEEKEVAKAYIDELNASGAFDAPIVTTLEPLGEFYPAEDYHQDYVRLNPRQGYVVVNALPKIEKVRKSFPELVEPR